MINNELMKIGMSNYKHELMQEKDSIYLFRVFDNNKSYILKYFSSDKYKKEINYYKILSSLGVQTLKVISNTDNSLLLEDISCSNYRLCTEKDYCNDKYVSAIARWFRTLHDAGKDADLTMFDSFLSPLTLDNILYIKKELAIENKAVNFFIQNYNYIMSVINSAQFTILHNDCGYNNSVISKDSNNAFMFDYNYMVKGLAYFDVYNFCANLNEEMKEYFLDEYGYVNPSEQKIHKTLDIILRLIEWYKIEGKSPEVIYCLGEFFSEDYYNKLIEIFS